MLRVTLRVGMVCMVLLVVAVSALRVSYGRTYPLERFEAYHLCDGVLCWHGIQPGVTPLDTAETLLREAGFERITAVGGEYVVAGWSVDAVNNGRLRRPLFDDSTIMTDASLVVSHIRLDRDICSHSVLAAWGHPDAIVGYEGNPRWLSYLYYTDNGNVVIFQSEYGTSTFTMVELMTLRNYRTFTFHYGNNITTWGLARPILEEPC